MPPLHKCSKCSKRAFTLRKLITHVGLVHAHEPHFSITCGINDCQAAFSKYHSFRRHVYRKHKPSVLNSLEVVEDGFENHAHKEVEDPHTHSSDETHTVQQPTPPSMDSLLDNLGDHLFSFILKCTEKNNLPHSVQQDIVDDLSFLLCFFKENYDSFIRYHLDKHGFRLSDCPELEQVLSTSDFFQKACDSIRSPFMIKEHCKSKMNMTEPISYTVRDHSGVKIGSYSYVPIPQVLNKYCQVEDVREQIVLDNHRNQDDDVLTDYKDGMLKTTHFSKTILKL